MAASGRSHHLTRRTVWLAYSIGAFGLGMGNAMLFLMPVRARELGAGYEVIGLIVAAAAIVPALLSVPIGVVVDRLGARRSFIIGTGTSAVVALTAAFMTNYWMLILIQLVFGATRGIGWIGSESYATGLATGTDRASMTGKFSFFSNLGTTMGPLAAGAVAQVVGFQQAFVFAAAYAAVFFLMGLALTKTSSSSARVPTTKRGIGFQDARKLLSITGIQVALFLTGSRLWMYKTFTGFIPVYLIESGVDAGIAGSVISMSGLVAMMTAPTTGFWCRLARPPTVAGIALGIGAAGIMIAPEFTTLPLVYLPPLMFGIAGGLSLPLLLTIITDAAPGDQRGLALGLRQMANNIAAGVAPLLVGSLVGGVGMTLTFPISGLVAGTSVLAALAIGRRHRSTTGVPEALDQANEVTGRLDSPET